MALRASDGEFLIRSLGEAGVSVLDCEHRTPKPAAHGKPYVAIPNIRDGRLDLSEVRLITDRDFASWTRRTKPKRGDLIVTRRGRVGDSAPVPDGLECAIGQNLVILRSDGTAVDQRFLRWLLQSPQWSEQVEKFLNVGAVFDSLNVRDFPKFELPVPPIPEQLVIAEVLGALDQKIELNERMNATLDGMARALFKSWFVDFDPVRAKAEGRQPSHMSAATAALFPDSFEQSEIGPIPSGWRIETIGDAVTVFGGSTPSTKEPEFWNGEHAFATPKDLSQIREPILLDTARRVTDAGLAKISSGLLPGNTVLMSSRAPIGYLAITQLRVAVNQGIAAMVCDQVLKPPFVLNWARLSTPEIESRSSGSTFPEISKSRFRDVPCVIPPLAIHDAFDAVASPIYDSMTSNARESVSLAELRGALLPRLVSGEIRVSHLDR